MTDADRTLAVAAILSACAAAVWAWRVRRLESGGPARRVAELRTANAAAVVITALGGIGAGLAWHQPVPAVATAGVTGGLGAMVLGALLLYMEPREALRLSALALGAATAAVAIHVARVLAGHGGPMPPPALLGLSLYGGYIGGICFLVRRR